MSKGTPTTTDAGPADAFARPQRSWALNVVRAVARQGGARLGLVWIAVMAIFAAFSPFIANSYPLVMQTEAGISSPLLRALSPADVVLPIVFIAAVVLLGFVRRVPFPTRFAAIAWIAAALVPFASWKVVQVNWDRWADAIGSGLLGVLIGAAALLVVGVVVLAPLVSSASWRFKLTVGLVLLPIFALLIAKPPNPPLAPVYDQYRQMEAAGEIEWAIYTPIPYSPSDRQRDRDEARLLAPWWGPAIQAMMLDEGESLAAKADRAREADHWLGTEENGADLLSRMIHASRIALAVGFIATGIAMTIGVIVGGTMGYFSGVVDLLGMRLVEVFEAIPVFFLLLIFVAFFGPNLYFIMVIIGITTWVGFARFTRAEFLKLRKQDFVQAAVACGIPLRSILFRHMLPNGMAPVLVTASFGVASAILYESTLSFLGLGLVDEPSWGQMLSNAVGPTGGFAWWMALFPGMAIFLTVFAYTLVGEALRDAIDPHLKKATHL